MTSKYITEPSRALPVSHSCEVLVCGGGIAGIAAALAAARKGKKVTLIEREFLLGGMATLGLVTIYLPLDDGNGNQVVFGLGEELLKLSIRHGAEANYPTAWLEKGSIEARKKNRYITQFNPYLFAIDAEKLLLTSGVNILYGSTVCGTHKNKDNKIAAVFIENKSGRQAIEAESFIDCTGDADLCTFAGAKTALHAGGNGLASWYYYYDGSKVTLKMFGLADVVAEPDDKDSNQKYSAVMVESLDENVRFSGVNGEELSNVLAQAHDKMYKDILSFRKNNSDFWPVSVSSIPLVRMSRRLVGMYELDDSEESTFFEDSIGMTGDWRKRGPVFELPFRTLYGKDIKNLLTAGRSISVTDSMWDITRVIPPCAVTGEAAGTAAALGTDFHALDVATLQKTLIAQGAKLHLSEL